MAAPRVLLVDDNERLLETASRDLAARGYEVVTASDGEEALSLVRVKTPDVVVTDIIMPNLDGWSFLREFRAMDGTASVPVIVLTRLDPEDYRISSFSLGADDFLPKPFKTADLADRIAAALDRRGRVEK
jgi:DNA-binding response OmpR family regulator